MIILGQTATSLETAIHFSTKDVNISVIKKQGLPASKEFCTCLTQCIPDLKVLTDGIGTDPIKNDWTSFFMKTINKVTPFQTGSIVTGTLTNLTTGVSNTLANVTYGTLLVGNFYWWYKLDWTLVYTAMGLGRYQITVDEVTILSGGETINQLCSDVFNLLPYSDRNAQGTVSIHTYNKGKLQHGNDYSNLITGTITVPFPFEQRMRLPGRIFCSSLDVDNDHLVLSNPNRSSYQIKDQLMPKYTMNIHLVGSSQIMPVVFDDLFGSEIYVTDYNVYNHVVDPRDFTAQQYVDLPVRRATASIPTPSGTAKRKTYSFEMAYEYDNVFKTNN